MCVSMKAYWLLFLISLYEKDSKVYSFSTGEMFSMIPYVVDLSKKLIPGLWEKVSLLDS